MSSKICEIGPLSHRLPEAYLLPCQTSNMKLFAKIVTAVRR